jgi:hypothetical protein
MDAAVRLMEKLNLPRTRQMYLECLYLGIVPDEIDSEVESMIPAEFQLNPPEEIE